jgi:NAD(P)H-hydrate epimerase
MRGLDRHTIETLGVPGEVLMESAGRAVVEEVLEWLPPGGSVVVVCGSGNNGGDGLVVARQLHLLGVPVRAALVGDEKALRGDAAANLKRARAAGVPIAGERWRAPGAHVIVDAIFGTGLSRDVAGPASASIRRINAARESRAGAVRVVAVDLPSGLCSDSGRILGVTVRADATVTIQAPKLGLALEPGRELSGRVRVARIGIAEDAPGVRADAALWTRAGAGARLPERPPAGHKGTFGHVLVVAGSEGKTGAAALAAEGATRAGAGLVTIACPAGLNDILEIKCTEAMTVPVPDTSERSLAASAAGVLLDLAAERTVVGLGPGVGRGAETMKLVGALVPRLRKPVVIDADGLFAFAGESERLAARKAPTVLIPRVGRPSGPAARATCSPVWSRACWPRMWRPSRRRRWLPSSTARPPTGSRSRAELPVSRPATSPARYPRSSMRCAPRPEKPRAPHTRDGALRFPSPSPETTREAAGLLASVMDERGLVVSLVGPLGAGKTGLRRPARDRCRGRRRVGGPLFRSPAAGPAGDRDQRAGFRARSGRTRAIRAKLGGRFQGGTPALASGPRRPLISARFRRGMKSWP